MAWQGRTRPAGEEEPLEGMEFLRRMAQGTAEQERVFKELWPQLLRRTRAACLSIHLVDQATIQEVTQDVAIRLFQTWPDYEGRGSVYTWAWVLARNAAVDAARRRGRYLARHELGSEAGQPAGVEELAHQHHAERQAGSRGSPQEAHQCVRQIIATLEKEKPRAGSVRTLDLLVLMIEGRENAEIADMLECSIKVVAERKRYARQKFSELCQQFCGNDDCGLI